jgi:putative oxidoreductase
VDWKRLVQFALLGSSDLEQYAILLVRVLFGLFFAISGARKWFVAGGTKPVCRAVTFCRLSTAKRHLLSA